MAEKFTGFSQEEINNIYGTNGAKKPIISSTTYTLKPTVIRSHSGIRRISDKVDTNRKLCQQLQQQQQQRNVPKVSNTSKTKISSNKRPQNKIKCNVDNDNVDESIVHSTMSRSIEEALFYQPFKKVEDNQRCKDSSILKLNVNKENAVLSNGNSTDESSILPPIELLPTQPATLYVQNNKRQAKEAEPVLSSNSPFKGISLKDFEKHRRLIEEQNRHNKDLLYKAIEHQSQKTAAEARKIEEIKAELTKLDNDLSIDVALLRKQIDTACIHFSNIEKQYVKIEAQFLKVKLELHKAAEKKELLTEHLCTVIAHNEDRKAKKLSELMEKVGLTTQLSQEYATPVLAVTNAIKNKG